MPYLYLRYLLFTFCFSYAQSKVIQGVIQDQSNKVIPGVNIICYPSQKGTQSDDYGRFSLSPLESDTGMFCEHIGYTKKKIKLELIQDDLIITLKQKVLDMDSLEVIAKDRTLFNVFYDRNNVINLKMTELSLRGFTDLGDALFLEQSILLNETINGQKNISIRASAPGELAVLLDGVRINRLSNPLLDLSMYSESSFSELELVKGPHEKGLSSSGTINLIPKLSYRKSFLFNQKFGTYNYGDYQILGSLGNKKVAINSGFSQGQSSQLYFGEKFPEIQNYQKNIFINMGLKVIKNYEFKILNLDSEKKYKDARTGDSLSTHNHNNILKMIYSNQSIFKMVLYRLTQISKGYEENRLSLLVKEDRNQSFGFELEKKIKSATIRFTNETSNPKVKWVEDGKSISVIRKLHNFTGSFEVNNSPKKKDTFVKDIKFLFGKCILKDSRENNQYPNFQANSSSLTNSLLTASLISKQLDRNILLYANIGNAFRVPSLSELIINQTQELIPATSPIRPEKKMTFELGSKLENHSPSIDRLYSLTLSYFKYQYVDKIKHLHFSGSPQKYPINIGNASLSGIDSRFSLEPKKEWLSYTSTFSYYYFSDPLAFQLQPDKIIRNIIGYQSRWIDLNFIHRLESSRHITTISRLGMIDTYFLEGINNYDISISNNLKLRNIKFSTSFSVRNLNNKKQELNGISLYDRRYLFKLMVSIE